MLFAECGVTLYAAYAQVSLDEREELVNTPLKSWFARLLAGGACASLFAIPPPSAQAQNAVRLHEARVASHDGKSFVVTPPDEYRQMLAARPTLHPLSTRSFSFGHAALPAAYSLAAYQTPIRNQADRGMCWAFAGTAALEAAYKRQYGVTLDLSEEYVFHVGKAFELYPSYTQYAGGVENNCSINGAQGSSDVVLKLMRVAICEEKYAPFLTQQQLEGIAASLGVGDLDLASVTQEKYDTFEFSTQHIPLAARWNARYMVTDSSFLPDTAPSTIEKAISGGHEVVADINVQWKWNAGLNAYDYDPASAGGGHCVLIIGYDRAKQLFEVKNSWGESGPIHVTYNFIQHCMGGGSCILSVSDPKAPVQAKAAWIGKWNVDNDGLMGTLVLRRFTNFRSADPNAPTKLGNYYAGGKSYDVNGSFTEEGRGLVMSIADQTGKVAPGTLAGQKHIQYLFGWDFNNAAGMTWWNNIPFGVSLSRSAMPSTPAKPFDPNRWAGTWKMEYDGWRGTLVLAVDPFPRPVFKPFERPEDARIPRLTGSFRTSNGVVHAITARILPHNMHELALSINMAGSAFQEFDLLCHTWEANVFSGVTHQGSAAYGIQGFK